MHVFAAVAQGTNVLITKALPRAQAEVGLGGPCSRLSTCKGLC